MTERFGGETTRRGALAALLAGLGLAGAPPATARRRPTVARCTRHVRTFCDRHRRAGKTALYERCLANGEACCRDRPRSPEVCTWFR